MRQILCSVIYGLLVFSSFGIAPKIAAMPENHDLTVTENDPLSLEQITNVNQLRDVAPS